MNALACGLCGEPLDDDVMPLGGVASGLAHRVCLLRSVMGGIGHLIAHDYWCSAGDPDAGLTYRQSALLVQAWIDVVGPPLGG